MLVNQFLRHLQTQKNYSSHTIEAYRRDLENLQEFLLKHYSRDGIEEQPSAQEVTYKQIRAWLAEQVQSGLSPRSVSRKLASVKSFFGYLYRQQKIAANPAEKVKSPKFAAKLPAFVPEREMGKLLDEIEFPTDFEGIRDKCMLEILYGCGIRRSELINLRLEDLDLFNRQLKVSGKGNKERIIPFGQAVEAQLREYLLARTSEGYEQKSSLFLRKSGENIYPSLLYRVLQKYMGLIDSPKQKSPHVLRHSYATHLLNEGADLQAIKELLGHSSLSATQVYTHHSLSRLKNIHKQAHPRSETDQND